MGLFSRKRVVAVNSTVYLGAQVTARMSPVVQLVAANVLP